MQSWDQDLDVLYHHDQVVEKHLLLSLSLSNDLKLRQNQLLSPAPFPGTSTSTTASISLSTMTAGFICFNSTRTMHLMCAVSPEIWKAHPEGIKIQQHLLYWMHRWRHIARISSLTISLSVARAEQHVLASGGGGGGEQILVDFFSERIIAFHENK